MSDYTKALEDELLGAVERLGLAKHPITAAAWGRSPARRRLAVASAAALTCATFAILLLGFGRGAPRAFAGWSPTPTTAAEGEVARVSAACRSQLVGRLRQLRREAVRQPGLDPVARTAPINGWRTVLIDTRGPYTMIVLEQGNGRATSTCFAGHHGEISDGTAIRDAGSPPPAPVPRGHIAYGSSGSTTTPRAEGAHSFSYVVGRTGAGVRGVAVRLNDGTRVTATTANGWFLAWWPGSHGIRATEVTTEHDRTRSI